MHSSPEMISQNFPTQALLTVHLVENHDFDPFKQSELVKNSVKIVTKVSNKNFKCEMCDKAFSTKETWSKHIKQVHDKANHSHKCDQCDFTTYAKHVLDKHFIGKHVKQTKFPCDKCSFVSNRKSMLNVHIRRTHEKVKTQKCDQCAKDFITIAHYKKHMFSEHQIVIKI